MQHSGRFQRRSNNDVEQRNDHSERFHAIAVRSYLASNKKNERLGFGKIHLIKLNYFLPVSSATRKLFRSLSLVMVFEVGTWLLTATNFRVIHTLDLSGGKIHFFKNKVCFSDEARNLLRFICGYSIHFGITIKTVIYYTTRWAKSGFLYCRDK